MRTSSLTPSRFVHASIAAMATLAITAAVAGFQKSPGPGDAAPPITLNALTNAPEGAQANWDAWSEGTTVIEFWGTWCGPCVAAIPHINELHDAFAPKGVNFLSVTFEEPAVVDRFRERMAINTWVGHDMDRAMVDAYGVRGWPTTFVIRDGVIIARTHPASLSHDRLAAIVSGEDDPAQEAQPDLSGYPEAGVNPTVGPDGRPAVGGGVRAGLDPFSMLHDEVPTVQVIVRKAGDASMSSSGSPGMTALGGNASSILPGLIGRPAYAVVIDPQVTSERFDVIYRVPQSQRESLMPLVRDLVAAGMGVRLETERRTVPAFELHLAEGGLMIQPGLEQSAGSSMTTDGTTLTYTSASLPFDLLVRNIANFIGAPVTDHTEVEGNYFINLTLPRDRQALPAALEEATGLRLVPTEKEIEVVVVKAVE